MRQLWVWLLLGAAAGSAVADCASTAARQPASPAVLRATALTASSGQAQPDPSASAQAPAGTLKVSAAPASATPTSPPVTPPERWGQPSLGLSLLITALAMLAIAWRRGRR